MAKTIRVNNDAKEYTGCTPDGVPHVHAGTCVQIIATQPYPRAHPLAGQIVEVAYIDAGTGAYIVHVEDDEYEVDPRVASIVTR